MRSGAVSARSRAGAANAADPARASASRRVIVKLIVLASLRGNGDGQRIRDADGLRDELELVERVGDLLLLRRDLGRHRDDAVLVAAQARFDDGDVQTLQR